MTENIVKFATRRRPKLVPYSSAEFAAHLNELAFEERLDLAEKLEGIADAIRRGAGGGYRPAGYK